MLCLAGMSSMLLGCVCAQTAVTSETVIINIWAEVGPAGFHILVQIVPVELCESLQGHLLPTYCVLSSLQQQYCLMCCALEPCGDPGENGK